MTGWRRWAVLSAGFMALVEVVDAPFIDAPAFVACFSAGGRSGPA